MNRIHMWKFANLFLNIIAYSADMFNSLNSLNMSLKGIEYNIFCADDKIETILKKTLS